MMQQKNRYSSISVDTTEIPLENLLEKEWFLSNNRGGFSSSTIIGCNTRQYHGLLTGTLTPSANRIMALSSCFETIYWGPAEFHLGTIEFPDKISPDGYIRLKRFSRDIGAHFHYRFGDLKLTKSVYLLRDEDTVGVVYSFDEVPKPIDFTVRPIVGLRDFHSLQKADANIKTKLTAEGLLISNGVPGSCRLLINCPEAVFGENPQWWYKFLYRADRERGQDFTEDLFTPGFFKYHIDSPTKVVLWANLSGPAVSATADRFVLPDIEQVIQQLAAHRNEVIAPAKRDKTLEALYLAADQFIAKRVIDNAQCTTILAGFPWFADWGRDAFISLPGLLLATRRFEEAKSVLVTFARAASNGMIPSRFDDYSSAAHFNSVDASLWFINAAFAYFNASGDRRTFREELLPVVISIINSYQHGTQFGIRADGDGLITAGDVSTQLTWMDAKFNGIVFTPRYGKTVEVNALWYNALMLLSQYLTETNDNRLLDTMRSKAEIVRENFCRMFWNQSWGWLNDCILPDGTADATLRPNQIFAVSLPFSPLPLLQQKGVVRIVEGKLLTPFGLRTLSPDDKRYQGQYTGPQSQRDSAYHQGTVWPYLMGPFVEAYLKVNGSGIDTKKAAANFIRPLLANLTGDGCIGSICEIFDGNEPQKPKGCFAQAWSVAELIRAYLLVTT
ncbi:MAG: amylo-alpha-1,6-glucosidase [Sedimentisphaerales bacterium]